MIIPGGYAQATLVFGGNGLANPGAVILGFDLGGTPTPEEVAESVHATWTATLLLVQNESVQLEKVIAKIGPNDTGPSGEFTGTEVGNVTGPGSPSNCTYLLKKNTALGGRKGRGRMYIPGVTESLVGSDGVLTSATVSSLNSEAADFLGTLAFLGHTMVVLHTDATTPTPVTSLVADSTVATQRRRLRR